MTSALTRAAAALSRARALGERWLLAPWQQLAAPLRRRTRSYAVVPVSSGPTDLRIEHRSGVVIEIEHDGRVVVHTPASLHLHATGELALSSDTHIGLAAPRIDLN